ncbi:MAG TPA: zinc-binding dehydrogenase [Nitrospiria bacterium]|nr:zinc-binding dehydrogenase [Nitrospiria bacterium]
MKAVSFSDHGSTDKLVYGDLPSPEPGPDEVLIRVRACSVNHVDIWVREGIPAYRTAFPHISGCDFSGVVEGTGKNVTGIHAGEKVFISPGLSCFRCAYCLSGQDNMCISYRIVGAHTNGGYAEYAAVPAVNVLSIPPTLSFEEAASFPLAFLTAWHMLITRAGLKAGQEVLVLAAGSGIGIAAIQIAKLAGAWVAATAGRDDKLERAKELGADEVINYRREDFSERVKELTGGKGVDVVFEHVGPDTWEKSLTSLAKNGKLVTCGSTSGRDARTDIRYIFSRQLSILGSMTGTRSELLELTKLMEIGKLKPVIDTVFPLQEARKAQERMLDRESFGKLILTP